MSIRRATFLIWLVPAAALLASVLWIGPDVLWYEMFLDSSNPAREHREFFLTSVFTLDCSADGETVLCGLRGEGARATPLLIWDDVGTQLRIPAVESLIAQDVLWQAALFPDGQSLLVAGQNSGISRVNLGSGEATLVRSVDSTAVFTTPVIAPCGRFVAIGNGADVLVIDAQNGRVRWMLSGPSSRVTDLAFSVDGTRMATARGNGEIHLWNCDSGEMIRVLRGHTDQAMGVRFVGDGQRLASVGLDGALRLWNTESAEQIWSEVGDPLGLRALAVAPDGRTAAAGGFAGKICLYDLDSHRRRKMLEDHTQSITALKFISKGATLISGSADGRICYWDASAGFDLVDCVDLNSH